MTTLDEPPGPAVSTRDLWKLGLASTAFLLGLLILFAMVPRQFGSLMARAFVPLRADPLAAGTTITIVKPAGGDAVVPAHQRVDFLAQIDGRFPPANAPAGCVMSQASLALGQAETGTCGSTVECPDLFVDDASITLK